MAKVKPILAELSGKLAGVVFSHNTAGAYVRQKQTPVNQNSTRQQLVRSRLGYISAAWQSLSDTQRQVWANWGNLNTVNDAFGNPIALTGQQAFVQLVARNLNVGNAYYASPPATTNLTAPVSCAVAIVGPAAISLTGLATLAAGFRYEVLATPGASAGRNPNIRAARWAGVSNTAAGGTVTMTSAVPFSSGMFTNVFLRVTDQYGQSNVPTKVRVQVA